MQIVEHPRRAVKLVDGKLVAHPDAAASNCAVWFPVPDASDGGPQIEAIPAVRLDGDRARLTGIPLFPYHAALGDEVAITDREGTLSAVEIVHATQQLVIRVFTTDDPVGVDDALSDPTSDEPFWQIVRALAPHHCYFERYSTQYAAMQLDVSEWEYVEPFLAMRERHGSLTWELATPMRA